MGRTVTYVTELLVGLACLGLAVPLWRKSGALRATGVILGVAGIAAVVHAVAELGGQ